MKRFFIFVVLLFVPVVLLAQPTYSTGGVNAYTPCGITPDLPWRILAADNAAGYFTAAHFPAVTNWRNGDVWGSDFRDGAGNNDADPSGGSDIPQIYLYAGHGTCQNPPVATDPDFITVCGNQGAPNFDDIGAFARWGSASGGRLQFLLLDASCPMDLVSIGNNWFPVFQGLHVATGHSGDAGHDTLDSPYRPAMFASFLVGGIPGPFGSVFGSIFPQVPVGMAWMATGLEDVQSGVCAVVIAAGPTEAECEDRRDNERLGDGRGDPTPNWFGWRWVCN